MIYHWDYHLKPEDVMFGRRGMSSNGPLTLSGRSQTWQFDAGHWVADLHRIGVKRENVKRFRKMTALLEGGAHQILVPVYDKFQAPWPNPGDYTAQPLGYTDGTNFSDGTGFVNYNIQVTALADSAYRSTLVNLSLGSVADIEGGEYFSFGLGHLHLITKIFSQSGSDMIVKVWPPLRRKLAAGEALNFDRPVCRMKLAGEGIDDLLLEKQRYGFPDLSFVEVFDPPTIEEEETDDMSCVKTQRKITAAGDYVLPPNSEDIIVVAKTTPQVTTITLPKASSRPSRKPIRIVDGGYNAAAFNITIDTTDTDLLMGGSSWIIDSNGASIEFTPLADGTGWV